MLNKVCGNIRPNYSFPVLIILTIFLGTSPLGGQPHLLEKITMLMAGILAKPIDIFDLLMHAMRILLMVNTNSDPS